MSLLNRLPCSSSVAAFFTSFGLDSVLVANTTAAYANIAARLAANREDSYDLRVRILEIVDERRAGAAGAYQRILCTLCLCVAYCFGFFRMATRLIF